MTLQANHQGRLSGSRDLVKEEKLITKEKIALLLIEACPSFESIYEASDSKEFDYIIAGEFARHLLTLYKSDDIEEFPNVAELIEKLHVNGDSYVKEFATVGILEDIQNVWVNNDTDAEIFETYLLPVSKKYWKSLNDFWQGEIFHVGSGSEES